MLIRIDSASSAPPYEQIRASIADAARGGTLPAGTRLPTVRHLADDIGVAAGTVARAYKQLEADGVIETRGRHGTFVSAGPDATAAEALAAAIAYVARMRRLGLTETEAVDRVRAAYRLDSI